MQSQAIDPDNGDSNLCRLDVSLPDSDSFNPLCSALWAVGAFVKPDLQNEKQLIVIFGKTRQQNVIDAMNTAITGEKARIAAASPPVKDSMI